jgi:hypothetical protein
MNVTRPNRMKTPLQHHRRDHDEHGENASSPRKSLFRRNRPQSLFKSIFQARGRKQPDIITPSITTSSWSNDNLEEIFRIEANKCKRQDELPGIPSIIYAPEGDVPSAVYVDEDGLLMCRTDNCCSTDEYSLCSYETQTDHNDSVIPVSIKIDANYEDSLSIIADEDSHDDDGNSIHIFEDDIEGTMGDIAESGQSLYSYIEDEFDASTLYSYIEDYYDDYSVGMASFNSLVSFSSLASF